MLIFQKPGDMRASTDEYLMLPAYDTRKYTNQVRRAHAFAEMI